MVRVVIRKDEVWRSFHSVPRSSVSQRLEQHEAAVNNLQQVFSLVLEVLYS